MKLAARSLSDSSSMTFYILGAKDFFFCLTSLTLRLMFNRWIITFGEISGISVVDKAKISMFALSRFTSCCRSESNIYDLIWTVFSGSSSFNGIETSYSIGSPLSSFFLVQFINRQRVFRLIILCGD